MNVPVTSLFVLMVQQQPFESNIQYRFLKRCRSIRGGEGINRGSQKRERRAGVID